MKLHTRSALVSPCFSLFWPFSLQLLAFSIFFQAPAAPGPGINQVTWLASEVGHEIYTFSNSIVGAQPTMNDFQWGYLVIGAAHSLDLSQPSKVSWYNFSNPRNPVLLSQVTGGNNKPHMIA